ncbi:DUF4012 domain-containing protein [Candidatus Gottesmanbacteria bacterium]|nr:DUF4012 domain-containing protein [Candidatus Gottesmanbacteria bacterium]
MVRKKTVESVQETQLPKALIVNGGSISSYLVDILDERGCQVMKLELYSPTNGKFDYIFLFDNPTFADEIYEKNLKAAGKFILIETKEDSGFPFRQKFKILKVGDTSFWSLPELADKILRTLFSSAHTTTDLRRKPVISAKPTKEMEQDFSVKIKKEETHIKPKISPTAYSKLHNLDGESTHPLNAVNLENKTPSAVVEKKHRFSFKKILLSLTLIIIGFLLMLIGLSFLYFLKVQKTFTSLEYHFKSSNLAAAISDLRQAKDEINSIQGVYDFSTNLIFPLKNISYVEEIGTILDLAKKVTEGGAEFTASVLEITPQVSGFGSVTDNISKDKLQEVERKLENFDAILIDSKGKIDKLTLPYFPKERVLSNLSPVISKLTSVYEFLPVFAQVFFQDTPKIYLVLFQNNMELRPTGGFIGSYGLLTVASGKIQDFKIEDVYTADGQLKGHVDPPVPIRKYLQQPHFFLRDSNFNPDFAISSVQASWFLQKELGKNVDGVIGVNLSLAQKIMQVVGPIKLSDFGGEEITADNFFYKVHYLSQDNFFPGSTQKKDVLTALAGGIFSKLTEGSKNNFLELVPVVKQSLEEKNILIYLDNPPLQKIIEDHGWAGRMVKVACVEKKDENGKLLASNSDSCMSDYLSINEANLGVNKANYFISKSIVLEKKIADDGIVTSSITISYENTNSTVVLSPQIYTNYLRVFVPIGSKLISVTLNGAAYSPQDVDTENYSSDKTSFGFLVKIAPDNKGVVKIAYTLPRTFVGSNTSYQLFYQKQGGDKNSPLIFSMTYPNKFKFKPLNFSSSSPSDNEIYYTTDTSVDRVFALLKE